MDGFCRPIGQKGAPMYAVLKSFGLKGLNGFPVEVEADISGGMPALSIVGLPDSAVRESGDRVHAALKNLGFKWPDRRRASSASCGCRFCHKHTASRTLPGRDKCR